MPGGGTLDITTRVWAVSDSDALPPFRAGDFAVVVEIADGGAGIPKEMFSKIFDPYFTTKPPGKGTGLGLTVTKSIIDLHGSRINVSNRSACGVAVTIALPSHNQDE